MKLIMYMAFGIFFAYHSTYSLHQFHAADTVPVTDFHIVVVVEKLFIPLMCIYRYSNYWCTVATCSRPMQSRTLYIYETKLESHTHAIAIWKFRDLCHFVNFQLQKFAYRCFIIHITKRKYFSNERYVVSLGLCSICPVI